jgi:hypothetical protein
MSTAQTLKRNNEASKPNDDYVTSVITAVALDTESMTVAKYGDMPVPQPNVFGNSWMRSAPAPGQGVKLLWSKKKQKYEAVGYEQPADSLKKLSDYQEKKSLYRPLRSGEHEVVSSGGAVTFWGSQAVMEHRVGPIKVKLDAIKVEAETKAPTHVIRLHSARTDSIGDEIRFGIVKRPTSANTENYALKAPLSNPLLGTYHFGKEFLLNIKDDMSKSPLIDVRCGDVFEDQLTPGYPFALPKLGDNNIPLRHWARYYNSIEPGTLPVPEQYTETQIDSLGNMSINLSKLSIIGYALNAPLGKIAMSCGLSMSMDAKLGITINALKDVTIKGMAGVSVSSPMSVSVEGTSGVTVKSATNVSVEGTAGVSIKSAASVSIDADVSVDVKSTASISVQAPMIELQGSVNSLAKHIDYTTGVPLFPDGKILL